MGKIFVLMGKSASGKDAVYRNLLQDPQLDLKKVVLYTTRPKRQGEMEGRQYFFISDATYEEMRKGGRIIEERSYATKLGVWHYFTADDGQIDLSGKQAYLMIATPEAFLAIRAYFGEGCVFPVLIQTDNGIRLERALRRERRQEVPRYDEQEISCRRRGFCRGSIKEGQNHENLPKRCHLRRTAEAGVGLHYGKESWKLRYSRCRRLRRHRRKRR